jgi:malate dehydrogenase (oxaloacetate-decarboxylating)(NADP+)
VTVGPILLGIGRPAHVLTTSATARRVVNMTAIGVVDAQQRHGTFGQSTGAAGDSPAEASGA